MLGTSLPLRSIWCLGFIFSAHYSFLSTVILPNNVLPSVGRIIFGIMTQIQQSESSRNVLMNFVSCTKFGISYTLY